MTEKIPDYELPSSKPEIWWAMKDFEPGQTSPEWMCTVAQNWSKAREAFPDREVIGRASFWWAVLEELPETEIWRGRK